MDLSQHTKALASGSEFVCETNESSVMDGSKPFRQAGALRPGCYSPQTTLSTFFFQNTVESFSKQESGESTSSDDLKIDVSDTNQSGRYPQPEAEVCSVRHRKREAIIKRIIKFTDNPNRAWPLSQILVKLQLVHRPSANKCGCIILHF